MVLHVLRELNGSACTEVLTCSAYTGRVMGSAYTERVQHVLGWLFGSTCTGRVK